MSYSKVSLETVDITDLDRFKFNSKYARELVEHENPEGIIGHYPIIRLMRSIKEQGFNNSHPDTSYHSDAHGPLSVQIVVAWDEELNLYRLRYGTHRFVAARMAGLTKIPLYVRRIVKCTEQQLSEFRGIVESIKASKMAYFQRWDFPGGITYEGRDDSSKIFGSYRFTQKLAGVKKTGKLPHWIFAGKTVLDIGMNTGGMAVMAGLWGATKIAGFDVAPEVVDIAKRIAKAYRLDCKIDFRASEFWDYPFSEKYDIVFANQCLYHFNCQHRSKCLGSVSDMLDRVCGASRRYLFLYTFFKNAMPANYDGGYYPTHEELKADLAKRGFPRVYIEKTYHPKTSVTAMRVHKNIVANDGEEK